MIAGIDFAGTVESSSHPSWKPGDKVILNGWGLGESHLGAYAEKARVKGDWLVRLPTSMSAREAMAIGTAGYTAMLCVMALERGGITPATRRRWSSPARPAASARSRSRCSGEAWLSRRSPRPAGQRRSDYLKRLGAAEVIERKELAGPPRPLGKERWAGAIDAVGSTDARQRAVDDTLWRCRHRLWTCRRDGLAGVGRSLHPARRIAHWN